MFSRGWHTTLKIWNLEKGILISELKEEKKFSTGTVVLNLNGKGIIFTGYKTINIWK